MIIEGNIQEVMESWPLQLIVQTHSGNIHVDLSAQTVITIGNRSVDTKRLSPGIRVRIEGVSIGEIGFEAHSIRILE